MGYGVVIPFAVVFLDCFLDCFFGGGGIRGIVEFRF